MRIDQEWEIKLVHSLIKHTKPVVSVDMNDKYIATGSEDNQIILFNLSNFDQNQMANDDDQSVLLGHKSTIIDLKFTLNNKFLVSGSKDKSV